MKRIFMVSLEDDDVPLSHNITNDIREIAYCVHEDLSKFDERILCIDDGKRTSQDGLRKNELYEKPTINGYVYRFDSDLTSSIDSRLFEPFILSDRAFGFTVYENSISGSEIQVIIDNVLKLLRMNYKYTLNSMVYDDNNIKNRFNAIDHFVEKPEVNEKVKKRVRSPIKALVSTISLW